MHQTIAGVRFHIQENTHVTTDPRVRHIDALLDDARGMSRMRIERLLDARRALVALVLAEYRARA